MSEGSKEGKELRLIVWTAEWCGACQALKKAKTCENLEKANPEVKLEYRDVEKDEEGADEYEVQHMPSIFFEDPEGCILAEHVGGLNAAQLVKLYQKAKAKIEQDG